MWERARVLLRQVPFHPVALPLTGAALGLAVGGLYGATAGSLHAVVRSTPVLFLGWLLPAAGAGTAAGFIMGVCSALDRAAREPTVPRLPARQSQDRLPAHAHAVPPRVLVPRR
jgi:hypothetical protein